MSARLMLTQHLHCCWTARRGHDLTYGGWGRDGVCAATLLSGKGYMSMVFPMTQCMQHTPLTQVYLRLAEQWLCVVTATVALARCAYIPYNGTACTVHVLYLLLLLLPGLLSCLLPLVEGWPRTYSRSWQRQTRRHKTPTAAAAAATAVVSLWL
jgi:hypothetical protein